MAHDVILTPTDVVPSPPHLAVVGDEKRDIAMHLSSMKPGSQRGLPVYLCLLIFDLFVVLCVVDGFLDLTQSLGTEQKRHTYCTSFSADIL